MDVNIDVHIVYITKITMGQDDPLSMVTNQNIKKKHLYVKGSYRTNIISINNMI